MARQAFVLIVLPGCGRVGVSRRPDKHLLFLVLNNGPEGAGIQFISTNTAKEHRRM